MEITEKDALDEAGKMMRIPMKDLPEEALEYLKYLLNKVGMCMETCLTAYAYYNQAVLNMKCDEEEYKLPITEKQWFIDKGYCK